MSFFRMKNCSIQYIFDGIQQILSVMAKRSLTGLSPPHKFSPAKRRGELLRWMIQNSCNSCGLFSRLHFVIMWLLQGTSCLPSHYSSQNMACGKQFPFTLCLVFTFPARCLFSLSSCLRGSACWELCHLLGTARRCWLCCHPCMSLPCSGAHGSCVRFPEWCARQTCNQLGVVHKWWDHIAGIHRL